MDIVYFLIQQMMYFVVPLMIVALAGMFSERSGIINIALDGTMIVGAFCGILFINLTQGAWSGQVQLLIAILIAAAAGMLFMMFHAFASINLNASQIISGIALNYIAPALSVFFARVMFGYQRIPFTNSFTIKKVPVLGDIPLIGRIFFQNTYISIYIGVIILFASWLLVFKTRFGLRLRACGEHPQAAESVGIKVKKMRYAGVLISGLLAGIGGIIFVIPTSNVFSGTVAGYGFLALAVLVFGQWKPFKILLASLIFGLAKTISSAYSGIPFLAALGLSPYIYKMIPYVFTIIMLIVTSRNPQAPKAEGKPYVSAS
jgi:general nucleoside transport system permease protein